MYIGLYAEYAPVFCPDRNETRIFSTDFRKIHKYQISPRKICPVGAKLFHADGRTDKTKLVVVFRNLVNALKMKTTDNITRFHPID